MNIISLEVALTSYIYIYIYIYTSPKITIRNKADLGGCETAVKLQTLNNV